MSAAELCKEIEEKRAEYLSRNLGPWPRNNPIASDIGPCLREMVLSMVHWNQRPPMNLDGKARVERGNLIEDATLRELSQIGIKVRVERAPFEIRDKQRRLILRGKVDGFIDRHPKTYPMEVKSMSQFVFEKIDALEDFDKFWWTRKYPKQLQAYLYANNLEEGFFLLDDLAGHWKLIPVRLDYEAMEKILQQCEQAVEHVTAKTLPDYHQDVATCRRCWAFGRVCDPPRAQSEGMIALGDPELAMKLDRRAELEVAHREYEALDKGVKASLKGKNNLIIGNWLITGEEKSRAYKAQEERTITFWQTTIERLNG